MKTYTIVLMDGKGVTIKAHDCFVGVCGELVFVEILTKGSKHDYRNVAVVSCGMWSRVVEEQK